YRPLTTISFDLEQEFIHSYRTGYYYFCADLDKYGVLGDSIVSYTNNNGSLTKNYEYNEYEDANCDGKITPNECINCWDKNRNFKNDVNEDVNVDGVYNEVDCQVEGASWRHLNNVLLYLVLIFMMFVFLDRFVFPNKLDFTFLSTLIFAIHPLNTESVAVISYRDEIFSLFFILFTLHFSFKYIIENKFKYLFLGTIGTLFALLSKEYGIILPILIPIGIHTLLKLNVSIKKIIYPLTVLIIGVFLMILLKTTNVIPESIPYFFQSLILFLIATIFLYLLFKKQIIEQGIPLLLSLNFLAILFYYFLRLNATNLGLNRDTHEILNNSYLMATGEELFCTKITVLLYYLKLLVLPLNLVCDYSYNSVEFIHFSDWEFVFSFILHLFILFIGIRLVIQKHVLGFAITFYFLFLLVIGNFFFFTGTIMNEHFIFHSAVGFSMIVSWAILRLLNNFEFKSSSKKVIIALPLLILIFFSGKKVISRNKDWCNDITLFLNDVENAPNSVICLGNAGARWIDLADTKEITGIFRPDQDTTVINDYNGKLVITAEELKKSGLKNKREVALNKGINYLERSVQLHPSYVNGYLNLGLAEFKLGNNRKAIYYWKKAEALYPNNPYLQNYYTVGGQIYRDNGKEFFDKGDYENAVKQYLNCYFINNKDMDALIGLVNCYTKLNKPNYVYFYAEKARKIDPDNKEIKSFMDLSKE
ncbi:MAG: tetratricopeptide repeat protein, partial [Bacteroidia bacterium]